MPFRDGTGPLGQGSMTGRGAGYCVRYAPFGNPNYFGHRPRLGLARRLGQGRGMAPFYYGAGRNYIDDELFNDSSVEYKTQSNRKDEEDFLKHQSEALKSRLEWIDQRIDQLSKESE